MKKEIPQSWKSEILRIQKKEFHRENFVYEDNPYYVLERIHSRKTRREVLQSLLKLNYGFTSPFPYGALQKAFPVLDTIKMNLIKENEFFSYYVKKGKTKHTAENLKCLIVSTKKDLSRYAFRIGYDVYMNHEKSGHCIIMMNPALKKRYSLTPLYVKLSRQEKEKWILWQGETVLRCRKTEIMKNHIQEFLLSFNFEK